MKNEPNRWLLAILRAAHCRSTHHHFAIDALPLVGTSAGQRLAGHLLQHHSKYLVGAKEPDTRFRDFHNHVIHVDDGYWGGAPRVAHQWYDRLQKHIRNNDWAEAARAAGVLSHYFTDPIQPLHTAQSPAEKVLHRPIEWSITKSYTSLREQWQEDPTRTVFQLSDGPGWLGEAILQSARIAHQHYDTLITHYDLKAGRSNPPAGLDTVSRGCLAQLVGLCITGWARVIERAALDAEQFRAQPIPTVRTNLATVLAGIRVPTQMWIRRIEHANEQRKVQGLIDEFQKNGTVERFLPSEVRVVEKVRKVYNHEREYTKRLLEKKSNTHIRILEESKLEVHNEDTLATKSPPSDAIPTTANSPEEASPVISFQPATSSRRIRLNVRSPLVDAPSIGEKTAARFKAIGIHTVADFLSASPEAMAAELATRWITVSTIHAWRCQAILMCQLPAMLARETQLLVGAKFNTADKIAKSNADSLLQAIRVYADTDSGRRHLRGAQPPELERVEEWIDDAALALVRQKRTLNRTDTATDTSKSGSIASSDSTNSKAA
ncbi:DUF4332 domain-containing protein [Neorhodopirellula lusitana]|uniref:DUF4332 domain-containing protein n=1 Tax=Neorhodopirellula lusitana TaxID=445327 RepID=UPI00384F257B